MTITPEAFRDFRLRWGSRPRVAEACDVTDRQVRRWETGATRVPAWTVPYLRMLAGELGAIDPQWEGWRLYQHQVCSPGNRGPAWDAYTLAAIELREHLAREQERALQRRIEELERELQAMRQRLEAAQEAEQLPLFSALPATVIPFPAAFDRRAGVRAAAY